MINKRIGIASKPQKRNENSVVCYGYRPFVFPNSQPGGWLLTCGHNADRHFFSCNGCGCAQILDAQRKRCVTVRALDDVVRIGQHLKRFQLAFVPQFCVCHIGTAFSAERAFELWHCASTVVCSIVVQFCLYLYSFAFLPSMQ